MYSRYVSMQYFFFDIQTLYELILITQSHITSTRKIFFEIRDNDPGTTKRVNHLPVCCKSFNTLMTKTTGHIHFGGIFQ